MCALRTCFELNWYNFFKKVLGNLIAIVEWRSPREIRQGEEIAWYADGETIVQNEHNPSIAYAYGKLYMEFIVFDGIICLLEDIA